jgi:hypothetical protein
MPKKRGSKADAIRAAIRHFGGPDQAKNSDVIKYVKAHSSMTTSSNEVSIYKSKMRKETQATPAAAQTDLAGARNRTQATTGAIGLAELVTKAKELVAKLGKEEAKRVIDAV